MVNKKVTFKNSIKIYLIQPYYELENYKNLWWTHIDKIHCILNSNEEIYRLLTIHPCMEVHQAMKLLYQPNNISYNPDNF